MWWTTAKVIDILTIHQDWYKKTKSWLHAEDGARMFTKQAIDA